MKQKDYLGRLRVVTCEASIPAGGSVLTTSGSPLPSFPFHTLQAQHPDKVLNNSYIVVLKDDLHSSAMGNHFNFLQAAHEEDNLLADGPVDMSQVDNGHLEGYAGRFTDTVIQRIREMPEVAYLEQASVAHALDTQRFAPWVRSLNPPLSHY